MADESSLRDFAASFQSFIQTMSANAPAQESPFVALLRDHFSAEPGTLPIITDSFEVADHANLQLAIVDLVASDGRTATLTGLHTQDVYRGITLADVVAGDVSATAPVEYVNLPAGDDRSIVAVQRGLYLIRGDGGPAAILVRGTSEFTYRRRLTIDVMAGEKRAAETLLHTLRGSMRARNVYRGQIISLGMDEMNSLQVHFHRLPRIDRQDIILPSSSLRQTAPTSSSRHWRRGPDASIRPSKCRYPTQDRGDACSSFIRRECASKSMMSIHSFDERRASAPRSSAN